MLDERQTSIEPLQAMRRAADQPPAQQRWENEGGAGPARATLTAMPRSAQSDRDALDDRQDELMARSSTDGRPPAHAMRILQWRWLWIVAAVFIGAVVSWILVGQLKVATAAIVVGYGILLMVGAAPVFAAGLMRGGEERTARSTAMTESLAAAGPS